MRSNALAHDASMHAEPVQLAISQGSACSWPARAVAGDSHASGVTPEAFEASWTADALAYLDTSLDFSRTARRAIIGRDAHHSSADQS